MQKKLKFFLPSHKKLDGFTAIELLVTIAIAAILAALTGPSFKSLLDRWRVQDAQESMQSTLYFARSEAIKRGGHIAIQKLPKTTPGCTLANTNGKWQATEERLQIITTPKNTNIIHKGGGQSFKIDRYGMMSGLNAKGFIFSPEPEGISSPATKGLCISSGGRIRVIKEVPCT